MKKIAGLFGATIGLALSIIAVFCLPGIFLPIPQHSYRVADLVANWTGNETIHVSGYTSLDRNGFVVFKLRVSSPDYKPLVQRALDTSVSNGKIAKYPGLRVWLDELTLSRAAASEGVLHTSTHMRARVVNDVTGTDHKEKEIGITFDVGVDEAQQVLVLTCEIGNISSFPGDVEQLMNSGCSMRMPICELTEGLELHDLGHQFINDGKMLGIEVVGRVRPWSTCLIE